MALLRTSSIVEAQRAPLRRPNSGFSFASIIERLGLCNSSGGVSETHRHAKRKLNIGLTRTSRTFCILRPLDITHLLSCVSVITPRRCRNNPSRITPFSFFCKRQETRNADCRLRSSSPSLRFRIGVTRSPNLTRVSTQTYWDDLTRLATIVKILIGSLDSPLGSAMNDSDFFVSSSIRCTTCF